MTDTDKIGLCKGLLQQGKSAGPAGLTLQELHEATKFIKRGLRIDQVEDLMRELCHLGYFSSQAGPANVASLRRYTMTEGGAQALELFPA